MPPINKKAIARLGGLFDKYKRDFFLTVSHDLTEPTCPTAVIRDNKGEIVARADCDSIEAAINEAVQITINRLLDGKGGDIWPDAMGTNPNDMTKPSKYETI